MDTLIFRESDHTYWLGKQQLPSVSTLLRPLSSYGNIPEATLAAAADFGSAVHLATEFFDNGLLDEDSLDPVLLPAYNAWVDFSADYAPEWTAIEARHYHQGFLYAGTIDRVGIVGGKKTVVDIKTTQNINATAPIQLAAYAAMLDGIEQTMIVQLDKKHQRYTVYTFTPKDGWPQFLALLTLYEYARKHDLDTFAKR